MGIYINPPNEEKEDFLAREGLKVTQGFVRDFCETDGGLFPIIHFDQEACFCLPVCLLDNSAFTAAAVCDTGSEFDALTDPGDRRPRQWFLVPIQKLIPVVDEPYRATLATLLEKLDASLSE